MRTVFLQYLCLLCLIASCQNKAVQRQPVEPKGFPNSHCKVPGTPIHWHIYACMIEIGTDDLETVNQPGGCLERPGPRTQDPCQLNEFWKRKWCSFRLQYTKFKTIEECVTDKELPPGVKNQGFPS